MVFTLQLELWNAKYNEKIPYANDQFIDYNDTTQSLNRHHSFHVMMLLPGNSMTYKTHSAQSFFLT